MTTNKNANPVLAAKPTPTNGKEVKSVPQDAVSIPGIIPEKRENVTTTTTDLPPIAARLKKLEEITELAERRETVTDAIQNLNGFYISPEGGSCNLRLTDSKGKTFAIAHPFVIGEMVSMAKTKLTTELNRIENLIDFTI